MRVCAEFHTIARIYKYNRIPTLLYEEYSSYVKYSNGREAYYHCMHTLIS